jgi:hypothetical protein
VTSPRGLKNWDFWPTRSLLDLRSKLVSRRLSRYTLTDLYDLKRTGMHKIRGIVCGALILSIAGFAGTSTIATATTPPEYALVTTGCNEASDAFGGAIVVTVYGDPNGNLSGIETVDGNFAGSTDPTPITSENQQVQASQFHSGQPIPLAMLEGAQANTTYSVSFIWTDGHGTIHTLSPNPTMVKTPECQGPSGLANPFPQLSYVSMLSNAAGNSYTILSGSGLMQSYGTPAMAGSPFNTVNSLSNTELNAPIVGMARGPLDAFGNTVGLWIATADGGVFSIGGLTPFYGSAGALRLNKPIVAMASTSSGDGYWLVASDGGVFSYGNAGFYGSTGALHLNSPIVGIAPTGDNMGYYLVAADGGVFAFGDARFQGSMGATHLNQPVVGMAIDPYTGGYWLAAADGGIFSFNAPFFGSTGNIHLNQPIVSFAAAPSGGGYWFMGADGGIFAYGNAPYYGSGVAG